MEDSQKSPPVHSLAFQGKWRDVPDTNNLVDPWKLQRHVMLISGQDVPEHFQFGKSSFTYTALVMEEAGELLLGVHKLLETLCTSSNPHMDVLAKRHNDRILQLRQMLQGVGGGLKMGSQLVRGFLSDPNIPEPTFSGYASESVAEVLDGITDLHVVLCGLSIASGLPGAAAFSEVNVSNQSKANPNTGLIDKDESGKWIKGRAYREPNLPDLITWHNNPPVDGGNTKLSVDSPE